jgi:transcription termination factor Rho
LDNDDATVDEGVLEILQAQRGDFGILRSLNASLDRSPDDIYVSPSQIRRFGLRAGHLIRGEVRSTTRDGSGSQHSRALMSVVHVNGRHPDAARDVTLFDDSTPIHPEEHLRLATEPGILSTRIVDLFAPIGRGQRSLIVAPPFGGKTHFLRDIAHGLKTNHPDIDLSVLLVDERPEEVTEMERKLGSGVFSSTFNEPPQRHVAISELVMEKARRSVEFGEDVVVLVDSLTRLARAYNLVAKQTGKTLTGGIDAAAMAGPRQLLGAARNLESGGSLTVIGTVLVDTGSRLDDYVYEDLKGTANSQTYLDRELFEKRVFPPIDVRRSETRREELLLSEDTLRKTASLRRLLGRANSPAKCIDLLRQQMGKTKTNDELLDLIPE